MAPKQSHTKKKSCDSPHTRSQVNMKLRSGSVPIRIVEHEASSRVRSMDTPPRKKGRHLKRCVFVEDEAQVDNDSNNIEEEVEDTELKSNEEVSDDTTQGEENVEDKKKKHSRSLGKQVSLGLMNDVLSQFYVKRRTIPPPVPLCRLVAHEAVRFATDDAQWLIPSFDSTSYLETMGHFLVSVGGSSGETMPVTSTNLEEWGPIWRQRNDEFERSLGREWQDLKGNKFLVWDGNHRLKTWWKRIKEKFSDNVKYHVSVRCQFIEVPKAKEAELLLALDTTNAISRAHVTPNIGHEVYMFQKFGIANKESILDRLTPEMRKWAEIEMSVEARYYHGIAPWYNSPCGLISQLVWKDEFQAFLSKEKAKIDALGLDEIESKKRLDKATRQEEERLKDRGYKYLSIANPQNGEEFFKVLFGLKWGDHSMLKITRDKLYCLSSSKIPSERKKILLHLMSLTRTKDPQCPQFQDYKQLRVYMKKETYWAHLHSEACLLIQRIQVEGPQLPNTFEDFFKTNLKNHVLQAFVYLMEGVKSSDGAEKMPELLLSTKRVVYRWILKCVEEEELHETPFFTTEWIDVRDENTMYSTSMLDRKITTWEANVCPWWLDYPLGIIPKQELELYERFKNESNEYIEEVPDDLLPPVSHDATQGAAGCENQATPLANTASGKGKGLMEAPESSNAPLLSPMTGTTPSTSSLAITTPLVGSSPMFGTTSSMAHTTSFVAESSLRRKEWERRPLTRSVGFQYQTYVDVLLVDVSQIDKFALSSIRNFFATQKDLYSRDGVRCREVARLIFADFPTSLLVDGLGLIPVGNSCYEDMSVPKWNTFSKGLVSGCMDLAREFLADEGFLVTMCMAEHIGDFIADASRVGLMLLRTWTLMCNRKASYRHPLTREAVLDLTMCLWYRVGHPVPHYDRREGEKIGDTNFPADCSYMVDDVVLPLEIDGVIVRGGAERSSMFFRWLLATFTEPYDYVLDVFAGCGSLGAACIEDMRHCMCLELDDVLYERSLCKLACGPMTC